MSESRSNQNRVRHDVRQIARDAARRSGKPLSAWLDDLILQTAQNREKSAENDESDGQSCAPVHSDGTNLFAPAMQTGQTAAAVGAAPREAGRLPHRSTSTPPRPHDTVELKLTQIDREAARSAFASGHDPCPSRPDLRPRGKAAPPEEGIDSLPQAPATPVGSAMGKADARAELNFAKGSPAPGGKQGPEPHAKSRHDLSGAVRPSVSEFSLRSETQSKPTMGLKPASPDARTVSFSTMLRHMEGQLAAIGSQLGRALERKPSADLQSLETQLKEISTAFLSRGEPEAMLLDRVSERIGKLEKLLEERGNPMLLGVLENSINRFVEHLDTLRSEMGTIADRVAKRTALETIAAMGGASTLSPSDESARPRADRQSAEPLPCDGEHPGEDPSIDSTEMRRPPSVRRRRQREPAVQETKRLRAGSSEAHSNTVDNLPNSEETDRERASEKSAVFKDGDVEPMGVDLVGAGKPVDATEIEIGEKFPAENVGESTGAGRGRARRGRVPNRKGTHGRATRKREGQKRTRHLRRSQNSHPDKNALESDSNVSIDNVLPPSGTMDVHITADEPVSADPYGDADFGDPEVSAFGHDDQRIQARGPDADFEAEPDAEIDRDAGQAGDAAQRASGQRWKSKLRSQLKRRSQPKSDDVEESPSEPARRGAGLVRVVMLVAVACILIGAVALVVAFSGITGLGPSGGRHITEDPGITFDLSNSKFIGEGDPEARVPLTQSAALHELGDRIATGSIAPLASRGTDAMPTPRRRPSRKRSVGDQSSSRSSAIASGKLDALSSYRRGMRLLTSGKTKENYAAARELLYSAAAQNYAPAIYQLGLIAEEGLVEAPDTDTASGYFLKAAEAGNVRAMHSYAVHLATNAKDTTALQEARLWFEKASQFGFVDSQFNLGVINSRGRGASTDLAKAYQWFRIAERAGDQAAAQQANDLARRLDREERARIDARVSQWAPNVPDPEANPT